MRYIKVAKVGEVPSGAKKKVTLDNKVLLLTNLQGTFYAIDNKCPHMGGSLFDGRLEGEHIVCPKHGMTFDVKTGAAVADAKLAFIKIKGKDTKAYPVTVEGDDVLVGIE